MTRALALALSIILALEPLAAAAASQAPEDKQARAELLVKLLKDLSDDEYKDALGAKAEKAPSREEALRGAYGTLAGLEYQKASALAPQSYPDEKAPAPVETGRGMDILKFLGNAALNYWLYGGKDFSQQGAAAGGGGLTESSSALPPEEQAKSHFEKSQEYAKLAEAPGAEDAEARADRKAERLRKLADLLSTASDEDYAEALKELPEDAARSKSRLASRGEVLRSAYATLAALEYRKAAKAEPESKRYAEAYERASKTEGLALDPATLNEAGWAIDLVKWLGNAALNYWLYGGQDFAGKGPSSRVAGAARVEAGAAVSAAPSPKDHFQAGQAYEKLAEAALSEGTDQRLARKKDRLRRLAELLEETSDEEFKDAAKGAGKVSREEVLDSAYATLAALEYRSAGTGRAADLSRLASDPARSLAVDPESLEETGWGAKLLGLAAIGGLGYALYENQRRGGKRRSPAPGPLARKDSPVSGNPYDGLWLMRIRSTSKSGMGTMEGCVSVNQAVISKGSFYWTGSHCGSHIACEGSTASPELISGTLTPAGMGLPLTFAGRCASGSCKAAGQNNAGTWQLEVIPTTASPCPSGMKLDRGRCVGEDVAAGSGVCVRCPTLPCGCDCYGMPRICVWERRDGASPILGRPEYIATARSVEAELASADLKAERRSELHARLGALYEALGTRASAAPPAPEPAPEPAAPPAPKKGLSLARSATADQVLLSDGSRLEGELLSASLEKIALKTADGVTGVAQNRISILLLRGAELPEGTQAPEGEPAVLKADGSLLKARLSAASPRKLHFRLGDGVVSLSRDQVKAVVYPAK